MIMQLLYWRISMKIKKTPEYNIEETDEAFAQADKVLKKITGFYDKIIILRKSHDDMVELVKRIGWSVNMSKDKMRGIIQNNILDYIEKGHISDEAWEEKHKMLKNEIGEKSFYDIRLSKEDLLMINKLNKDYEEHSRLMADVWKALHLLQDFDVTTEYETEEEAQEAIKNPSH